MALSDPSHTFHFDTTFQHLHLKKNCEISFFCNAFSLIDSMCTKNVLHRFTTKLHETKGIVEISHIIQVLKDENVIPSHSQQDDEEEGLVSLFEYIYMLVDRIVRDGFVSLACTSTLGELAYAVGELYLGHMEKTNKKSEKTEWKVKAGLWKELSEKFMDLAKYQQKSMRIHHDFQKSNYAPDPRSKTLYGSTFFIIILGFLFLLLRNCKMAEVREFVSLLSK
ncbi:unnamed protein product [Orchesella dallaii]|uniref:Uncharacterized protein n=1 Tax=Orchesella dallaii TaxID=48710 RepID=A0ABP1PTE3_9HEXA